MNTESIDENLILRAFGERLREARESLGISQREFAKRVGKAQALISKYETGTQAVRITEIPVFAKALEVSVAYLFGETGEELSEVQRNTALSRILLICSALGQPLINYTEEEVRRFIKAQYYYTRTLRPEVFSDEDRFPEIPIEEGQFISTMASSWSPIPKLVLLTSAALVEWIKNADRAELERSMRIFEGLDWTNHFDGDLPE